MIHNTAYRLTQGAGALGAMALGLAWADSHSVTRICYAEVAAMRIWSPRAISSTSRLDLFIPTPGSRSASHSPSVPSWGRMLHYPIVFAEDLTMDLRRPFVVKQEQFGYSFSYMKLDCPCWAGDPVIHLSLPYCLLLTLWCAGWGGATACFARRDNGSFLRLKFPLPAASR